MIQDVAPPSRPRLKQKVIEPLPKPERPSLVELARTEDPDFKTPDEIAAEDTVAKRDPAKLGKLAAGGASAEQSGPPEPPAKRFRFRMWRPHGHKQWIIASVATVLVLGGAGVGVWKLTHHSQPPAAAKKTVTKKAVPPPKPIYSDLSGLQITDASLNQKPVTAVMVENSTDARPQSGLSAAGVVFEAQAEGGVTRFMALYQDTAPDNVGPIRSARPYYVQWALGFDAAYAHVGGSPDALSDIASWGVHDMNQFYNGNYYHRITTRAAPHNVYTGVGTLNDLEASKGYGSTFSPWPRADKETPSAQPTANSIDLAISSATYNPHYDYDTTANAYKRSTAGVADTDANTGQQLEPKVVVAIVVPLSRGALDASNAYYSNYNVLGDGAAYIFQNGNVTQGQWHKATNTNMITFTDTAGNTIPLNRGQTWIATVSAAAQVKYTGVPPTPATKP
jgi:DUF3048 family protein